MTRLTAWLDRHVEDETGRRRGRVYDLRVRWTGAADDAPVVTALVFGTRGLLERLGLRRTPPGTVRWENVAAVRDRAVIVRR